MTTFNVISTLKCADFKGIEFNALKKEADLLHMVLFGKTAKNSGKNIRVQKETVGILKML